MTANKFILTYRNGKQEEVITDAETCADQCMRSFGLTLTEAQEFGGNVEFASDVNPPAPAPEEEQVPIEPPAQPEIDQGGEVALVEDGVQPGSQEDAATLQQLEGLAGEEEPAVSAAAPEERHSKKGKKS